MDKLKKILVWSITSIVILITVTMFTKITR